MLKEKLANWFINQKDTVTYKQIAEAISFIKKIEWVNAEQVRAAVCDCRPVVETLYCKTIINVKGYGYRISTPAELAMYTCGWISRTASYLERSSKLMNITDPRALPPELKGKYIKLNKSFDSIDFADFKKSYRNYIKNCTTGEVMGGRKRKEKTREEA